MAAQALQPILGVRGSEAGKVEYGNSSGTTCRYNEPERPSINIGIGIADSNVVIPGIAASDSIVIPSRQAAATPIAGVAIRVPFGGGHHANCDRFLRIDAAMTALEKAKSLFDDGYIDKAKLQVIADRAYAELLR